MRKKFSTGLFGYKKREVERYLADVVRDYEEELGKKRDRMMELAEEARSLKLQNQEQSKQIEQFIVQEKYISSVLIKAEERAQAIIEEGKRKSLEEMDRIQAEKERWRSKQREIRRELLEFEKTVLGIIERFRDEINYYTAMEISESILADEKNDMKEAFGHSNPTDYTDRVIEEETLSVTEGEGKEAEKEKVIA